MRPLTAVIFSLPIWIASASFSTAIGDAAALMKPKSWRPLTTQGLTEGMFKVGVGVEPVFVFSNNGVWDPMGERMLFLGAPHQFPWVWGFPVYEAKTNTWRKGNIDPYFAPNNRTNHTNDNLTIVPEAGKMYFWPSQDPLLQYDPDTDIWSAVNTNGTSVAGGPYSAMEYFPEMNGLVKVNAGLVECFSFSTSRWSTLRSGISMGGIHNMTEYNPVHHQMLLGGGLGSRQLHIMDAQGNLKAAAPAPFEVEYAQCILSCDPVTGTFLVLKADSLYSYDMIADKWAGVVKCPILSDFSAHWMVAVPVSTYGVIAYLTVYQWPVLLYKHADQPAVIEKGLPAVPEVPAFPSPVQCGETVRFPGFESIKVFNLAGQCVSSGKEAWNTTGASAGLYLVRAVRSGRAVSCKILLRG